jgi:putative transposase
MSVQIARRTFLANHAASLVSMDFFTVPTLTGRVLFVFVLLAHQRRRIVHFAITDHPTIAWTGQQMVEAFPDETASDANDFETGHRIHHEDAVLD